MRVVMTTDTVGGVWTFTQELTAGLLDAGDAVALLSLGRLPGKAQQRWVDDLTACVGERLRFVALDTPLEWMTENGRALRDAAPVLSKLVDDFDADVLHANQFCFGALQRTVPCLITAHSDVLTWAESCRGGVMEDSAWLRLYRALLTEGLCGADAVAAPTQWMLRALGEHVALAQRTCVIANGRQLAEVQEQPPRSMQAVTAGRLWDEAKNVAMLASVISPVPLLLAGERALNSEGLPQVIKNVTCVGPLDTEALHDLFRRSALYICCSRYEPFGLAPLEAALCGCAVLAFDLPSLREVWADGAAYFSDAQALSALLMRLSLHGDELRQLQERSTARAGHYTRKCMTSAYRSLYQELRDGYGTATDLQARGRELSHVA